MEEALLEEESVHDEDQDEDYTGDGSVDLKGRPILKHKTGNWKACFFILGTECCERLAYYGVAQNLVTYLTKSLQEESVVAARNVTTWQGTCYLTPLIGAILADSYWGKYWTIVSFTTIYFIGLAMLTVSASLPAQSSPPQKLAFFLGLYMIALGAGGIKPCVSSFGADQFDDTDPLERPQKGSFFNWFYFCIHFGSLISSTILVYIQDNYGWGLGFGIPTLFMALAVANFFIGSGIFRFQKPGGSPIIRICQVIVAAFRKWNVQLPDEEALLYEVPGKNSAIEGSRKFDHTNELRFLDKAAIITPSDAKSSASDNPSPWRLCTITQVEELKLLVRMFPIWATTIVFSVVPSQNSSMFLEQGMLLDKRIGSFTIPPASLSTFDVVSVLILVLVYDKILVPVATRFSNKERGFTDLQRMGIGLFMSILAMVSAALVEIKRLEIAQELDLTHEKVEVPMSILWQIPQYAFVGAGVVFTSIGQIEFFYDQSPDAMRSLCTAFALVTVSLGSYLSSFILTLVSYFTTLGGQPGWIPDNLNEGHLDRFFWLIAGLSLINLVVYVRCALRYKYKKAA
ncbi:hypothetical protein LUZ61_014339 [Rhynchospora tenuis]|uniref:Uncharacterized protein n=1 Tax=Rhynchospora tenuis TaxID=198213 RepID=A0AAD5Z126_9POAL|nr:hypothetical protein LUZ61_014339 [Rhynchospora tenuis]